MEYRKELIGKGGITAKIVADSRSTRTNIRITTFELEYPRFIHAELMTHRLFSRNSASSRAIPVDKMIVHILANTAMPIHWGKNQPGMSAKEECDTAIKVQVDSSFNEPLYDEYTHDQWWGVARDHAISMAKAFHNSGYHKQIVNRLLEPFQFIKVIVTATEYDNFYSLRHHPDAQPEIQELARVMLQCSNSCEPIILEPGDWHVPYYKDGVWIQEENRSHDNPEYVPPEDALAVSASCCAQVSYRRLDDSVEKARDIFRRLVESKPVHASPFEHQASPMVKDTGKGPIVNFSDPITWEPGTTHVDGLGDLWSGNFRGWIQHRQLIEGNTCWDYPLYNP